GASANCSSDGCAFAAACYGADGCAQAGAASDNSGVTLLCGLGDFRMRLRRDADGFSIVPDDFCQLQLKTCAAFNTARFNRLDNAAANLRAFRKYRFSVRNDRLIQARKKRIAILTLVGTDGVQESNS